MTADEALTLMNRLGKTAPEGDWHLWVQSCQMLADVIAEIAPRITEEQLAVLIGVGAKMSQQGFREMQAVGLAGSKIMQAQRKPD